MENVNWFFCFNYELNMKHFTLKEFKFSKGIFNSLNYNLL